MTIRRIPLATAERRSMDLDCRVCWKLRPFVATAMDRDADGAGTMQSLTVECMACQTESTLTNPLILAMFAVAAT